MRRESEIADRAKRCFGVKNRFSCPKTARKIRKKPKMAAKSGIFHRAGVLRADTRRSMGETAKER
jgi:hypothetical protein